MPITYRKGDVIAAFLEGKVDMFAHGCNAQGVMGSGVAKQVKERLPALYNKYIQEYQICNTFGWRFLGSVSSAECCVGVDNWCMGVNMITQERYGRDGGRYVNYGAVASCFEGVRLLAREHSCSSLGIPKIGAGLGGGDWGVISEIIEFVCPNLEVVVYEL